MSDITRSESIKQLHRLKADIISGLAFVSKTKDRHTALKSLDMAIASMETDEAYQLEYESTKNCESCRYYGLYHEVCNYCYECSLWAKQEPTTKNDHHRQNIQAYAHDFGVSEEQAEKELRVTPQEPRWIPVSERLPEDSGEYLVSVVDEEDKNSWYKQVGVAWFAHKKDYDIKESEWRELGIDEKVIAWMPLPKAYKEVEE